MLAARYRGVRTVEIEGETFGGYIDAERAATERAILDCVRELRAAGMTVRAIADELAARGMRTRTGGRIMHTQVARFVKAA